MPEPLIRPAVPADIPAITAIYRPSVLNGTASFELDPPNEAEMLARWRAITDAGFPYLAVEQDGQVVAYGYANHYRTRPAYRFTVEDSVYVAPEMHGQGLGRTLLAAVIAKCAEKGLRQMIAVIGDSEQYASIRLHRALGFQFAGTLHSVGWKHRRWLDGVLMQRSLGKGDSTLPASGT